MIFSRRKLTKSQMPDESPVFLTPEGIERLKRKLALLKHALPERAEEAARTAAYGDRSDSAEYKEAKSILRRTQGQIWNIESQLKRVVPIIAGENGRGTVELGSTVVVMSGKSDPKTFLILGPSETNPGKGCISFKSPLGAALLHHSVNDVVTVETPGGIVRYQIIEIRAE